MSGLNFSRIGHRHHRSVILLSQVYYYRSDIDCNFLHLQKITTLFFSWDCTLFDKKQGGVPGRAPLQPRKWHSLEELRTRPKSRHPVTGLPRPCRGHPSRATSHQSLCSFIPQSTGSARTATRGRSTVHRSGIPCALPSPEFLRPDTYASFPSIWFHLRLA